jgi:cell division transport system permease protein
MSRFRRLDLPLERDGSGTFLSAIAALMVYLATLAVAFLLVVHDAMQRWDDGIAGALTVQLPPEAAAQAEKLAATLRQLPGVRSAAPLDEARARALLEPWLGPGAALDDLPLPRLLDVRVDPQRVDLAAIRQRVASVSPAAVLDDPRAALDRLFSLAATVEWVAVAATLLIGGAAILCVVFATRTGLAIHHGVVEVLHLIGARDAYVARQFAWQAVRLGLKGGLIGFGGAVLTLAGVLYAASAAAALAPGVALLPAVQLRPWHWAVLAALPLLAGAAAMLTARVTVMRSLARMP